VTITPTIITSTVTTTLRTLTATTNLTVTAPALQSIAFTPPPPVNPAVGTSTRFLVTATFNNGWQQDVTYGATWTSSNPAIATVGDIGLAKGRVTGVAVGTTIISATYGGSTPITATVQVTAATTLQAANITVSGVIAQGNQVSYKATAANGQDVTEDTTWKIDDPSVAILADSLNQPGQVVGVAHGTTTLRATFGVNTLTTPVTVQ
jgi:trimeric autotransporter adhesin